MAIGIDRSAGYNYAGLTGVLNGIQYTEVGQSVVFYIVAAGVNLSAEDDAANDGCAPVPKSSARSPLRRRWRCVLGR